MLRRGTAGARRAACGYRGIRSTVRRHVRPVQNRTKAISRIRGMPGRRNATVAGSAYATKNPATQETVKIDSPHDEMAVAVRKAGRAHHGRDKGTRRTHRGQGEPERVR